MVEENKSKKSKITLIITIIFVIILVVGSFYLGMYVANNKNNDVVNNDEVKSNAIESVMPKEYDESVTYNTEEIKKYYELVFQDDFNRSSEKILDDIEFVKVNDGQLMWNIDNNWENDLKVADCVYLEAYGDEADLTYFYVYVITSDNSLYYYQIDNVDAINVYGYQDLSKITIANKDSINEKKIDLLENLFYIKDENNTLIVAKKIEKIISGNDTYYVIYDINNRVFSVKESKLTYNLQIKEYKNNDVVEK